MNSKRKLFFAAAIIAVLAIPTMAWAFSDPFGADRQLPAVPDSGNADGSYGWMDQMHDYMWNGAQLPEDFPANAPWMNQMHDYMWGNTPADGSYDWMHQMHDYMWNGAQLPEDFPGGPVGSRHPMGAGMWGNR